MTYQDLEQLVEELQQQISNLTEQVNQMSDASLLTLDQQNALQARGFVRSTTPLADISPLLGTHTYWVATISGGVVNTPLTFVDGILTTD